MKKIFAMVLCFCMFAMSANAASLQFTIGSTQVKSVADDKPLTEVTLETAPFTVDGRTMVPVRVIAENFGASVGWDEATQTVTVSLADKEIVLVLGKSEAFVNGESVTLDVAAMEHNGRTLVPLRFVTETFGYNVKYIPSVQQIYITDSPIVFASPYTFITLDELYLAYIEYGVSIDPTMDEEFIRAAHVNALNEIFQELAVRTAIYDYVTYKAPDAELTNYVYALLNSADYQEALAQEVATTGILDVVYNSYMEMSVANQIYPEFFYERLSFDEVQAKYESEYICAKHILIPTVNLQNGAALSDQEVTEAKALAEDLCVQIANGADFDMLMQKYSKDGGSVANPDGYVFTKGEMVEEFYNGANALEIGAVSAPVLSPFGYHIIKREPLPELLAEQKTAYAEDALYNALVEIMVSHDFNLVMDLDVLLDYIMGK